MRKYLYPIVAVIVAIVTYLNDNGWNLEAVMAGGKVEIDGPLNYLPSSKTGVVIQHNYYILSYDEKHEQPEWVAYHLEQKHTKYNKFDRPYFGQDPKVLTKSASWKNYKNSGYDKGHLCPAADRKFKKEAFEETFLTSNICPQKHSFNAGIWGSLEKRIRKSLKVDKDLYIVTGPVLNKVNKHIGSDKVSVPEAFFKIVLRYNEHTAPKMVAFLIPHNTSSKDLSKFIVSVDELETVLGFDFFADLPDDIEQRLEDKEERNWIQ